MDRTAFETEYSDEWWFQRLFLALHEVRGRHDGAKHARTKWMDHLWSFYIGNPPLPQYTEGWQAAVTQEVLRMSRVNFADLIVDSKLDRTKLRAFRTADPDDDEDESENSPEMAARRIMKRNRAEFYAASRFASVMSEGYLMIDEPAEGKPSILTAEDPRQCVTINDAIDKRRSLAGLKVYLNNLDGLEYAHVLIAGDPQAEDALGKLDRVRRATRRHAPNNPFRFDKNAWTWIDDEAIPTPTQGRGIMLHRLDTPTGIGDFESRLDLIARIQSMILDRLWISKLQVFRQRALEEQMPDEGDDHDPLPEDDEDGEEIDYAEIFSADPGTLWRLPYGMKIWESTPTDLTPVLLSVRDDIKELAAGTRTALYILFPEAAQGSAEGASLTREGQTFKCEAWAEHIEPVFLEVCADLLAAMGQQDAADGELELVWAPAERFSLSQRGDAAVKAKESGVPWGGIMEDFHQADPTTVARWRRERSKDLLFQAPGQTPAPTPTTAAPARTSAQPAPDDAQR